MAKNQAKWQKSFLKKVFNEKAKNQEFADRVFDDLTLLNSKNTYLPNSLFKFYKATSENILDLKNKRLWLSHPSTFNDPYDCKIGYNEIEYEKLQLLDAIKNNGLIGDSGDNIITLSEYNELNDSCVNGEEYYLYSHKAAYDSAIYKILANKSKEFQSQINILRYNIRNDAKQKMDHIIQTNIRVACFSANRKRDIYYSSPYNHESLNKIQMWSHYADNHKGYCVEYDLSTLKKDLMINYTYGQFYSETDRKQYLDERLSIVVKGGLFPVIYTSNRINLPYKKLKEYNNNDPEKITRILYNAYITKSPVWGYENEWRLIIDDKISNYYSNKIPFPYIKTIYLGCKMEQSNIDELLNIADELGVEAKIMNMENNKFDMFGLPSKWYNFDKHSRLYNNPFAR